MTGNSTNIQEVSSSIRAYTLNPVSTDAPNITPQIKRFIEYLETSSSSLSRDAGPIAETALNLYRIANSSKDSHIVQICLHALLCSGRFGRILVSRFIHSKAMPLRELAAKIATLSASNRLSLAHEMLLNYPGDNDKETLSWLESLMTPLADTDPIELVPFIAGLGKAGDTLAFPAQQVIMNGEFGEWIATHLETGASDHELEDLCNIVIALDDEKLAQTMAVSVSVGFIKPTIQVIQTITAVAEAKNKSVLDMLLKVLKKSKDGLAGVCIDGIIAQDHPSLGKLMATIRTRMPALKKAAVTRVPLLGDKGYASYLSSLPEKMRAGAQLEAFGALTAIAPDFINNVNREGTSKGRSAPLMSGNAAASDDQDGVTGSCQKPGFFAKLFNTGPKKLEQLLPKLRNIRDMDLSCSRVEGEELDGRELTGLTLSNSAFIKVDFIRSKIASNVLTGTVFSGGSATGSTFNANDFTGVDFTGLTFTKCSFNNCNFTGAAFTNCEFRDCKFRSCTMCGAAFLSVTIRLTGITTSALSGCSFYDSNVRTTRFEDVDLTGTDFTDSDFRGVEFFNTVFHAVSIQGSILTSVDMPGSSVTHSTIRNSDTPHALFLANRVRQLAGYAHELEKEALPNVKRTDPAMAQKVMIAWSRELTFLKRERRMICNNRRRLARAINSMEREQQIYVRILPHLLETDVFERKFELENVPSCRVWGYYPGLTTLELSKQYFPDHKPKKSAPEVRILAVYAMGSLGTVAQTAKSDLDCWVCYDGDLSLDTENGLKRKLDAIGLWAESEFGLEAHFFPMRMDDVRYNRFSSGEDEESSGSAQALLLKEEFYRTALKLSGKNIAWWVTPAGADKKAYDNYIQASRRYPITGKPRLEDFGHLAPIPPDEYFGGSLWQMAKAIHSPFKSVLKLGLLETYADPKTSPLSLCDRIKLNLTLNRRDVRHTDPYATLFSTLHSYYAKRGDKEAAALLTESFMFKANLCDIPFFMGLAARSEDQSLISALFGPGNVDPSKVCNSDVAWTFDKSLKMGADVRQYMVNTYQRIQAGMSEDGKGKSMINAEDLTRMGRRIGANFSKKQHKIMRVPLVDTKGGGFPILHFSAQKAPGKKPIWVVRGGSRAEAKKSADSLQLLHRSGDPVHMLAWLLANQIYHPKSLLQADRTVAPIAVADIQKVMPSMHEFFPFYDTFERDISEGLAPERVIRVFFIINLTTPADTKKIEQASVIYTTNWGEMYCRTFLKPGPLLEKHPSRFLAQNLDHPVTETPDMLLFLPKGSQCKRINLI